MHIKKISLGEQDEAMALVLKTFLQYEAPDYGPQGVETFCSSVIENNDYLNSIVIYGAYEENELRGVIATRNEGNHIALFFVDGNHHRKGIGKSLFQTVLQNSTGSVITVNSSPYAKEIYEKLGFTATSAEQSAQGMLFTPMKYIKNV